MVMEGLMSLEYFFWVYRDAALKWRWRLYCPDNRTIIADSGQGYGSRAACENGIALVKRHAPLAPIQYHQ
jgi:uncharacterized protein YegP (UPF0339 family)